MPGTMNDVTHELLNKIRVIGKIKEGQKLDTSSSLTVYTDTWFNWVFRKWNRDNKDEGVKYLRDLYKALQQSIDSMINETISSNDTKKSHVIYVLINAATELKSSIKGLDNLAKTYRLWPATLANIEGIVRDYVIPTFRSILEAIPSDKITKELLDPITYQAVIIYNVSDPVLITTTPILNE